MELKSLKQILNSDKKPTLEIEVEEQGKVFSASLPSGVSVGCYEAVEVGVEKAIENVKKLFPKVKGLKNQQELDQLLIKLDGTRNKSNLGANTTLGLSIVFSRAFAGSTPLYQYISQVSGAKPCLPKPCVLMMEGGKHGQNGPDIQEFMLTCSLGSFKENYESLKKSYFKIKEIVKAPLGKEGGFVASLKTRQALDILKKASKADIYLDAASSHFFKKGRYFFEEKELKRKELLELYKELIKDYGVSMIEDPFSENDFKGFKKIMRENVLVLGDDLTTTNVSRMKKAKKLCKGVVIKPNQIGTLTEAIKAVHLAKSFHWKVIVSHRGGETMDDFISDFAVGVGADFIKAGGPLQKEREVKYERLLEIEKELTNN